MTAISKLHNHHCTAQRRSTSTICYTKCKVLKPRRFLFVFILLGRWVTSFQILLLSNYKNNGDYCSLPNTRRSFLISVSTSTSMSKYDNEYNFDSDDNTDMDIMNMSMNMNTKVNTKVKTKTNDEIDPDDEWGIKQYQENFSKGCPTEPIQVVNDAFDAIAGTLYNKQKLDPVVAINARSNSFYTHRPIRSSSESGRIGIEIDGSDFFSLRYFSLLLAAKLSSKFSWRKFENEQKEYDDDGNGKIDGNVIDDDNEDIDNNSSFSSNRPVVLSFNTIKEALLASREMQILQINCRSKREREAFNHIVIQTLHDGIPKELKQKRKYSNNNDYLAVDATKGLLVVVQPTDFNQGFNPPAPSINTINDFQTTTACALLQQIPVVVLSPRFLSYGGSECHESKTQNTHDDDDYDTINNQIYHNQNGFFQQASFYGGKESPRGSALFILRDFSPPSYCWIGKSFSIGMEERYYNNIISTRLILTNSVMDEDHPWHMYAFEKVKKNVSSACIHKNNWPTYLASTRSSSGRPTWALMNKILLASNHIKDINDNA